MGLRKSKIVVFSDYYYLSYEAQFQAVEPWVRKGVKVVFLTLASRRRFNTYKGENLSSEFSRRGFTELSLFEIPSLFKTKYLRQVNSALKMLVAVFQAKLIIRILRPRCLLISSPMPSETGIQLVLEASQRSVPIFCALVCGIQDSERGYSVPPAWIPNRFRRSLHWSFKDVLPKDGIHYLVAHTPVCESLKSFGVAERQISVLGPYERLNFPSKAELIEKQSLRRILLLGECLNEVLSDSEYRDILNDLGKVFSKLGDNIELIFRPHPRESQESITAYNKLVMSPRRNWTIEHDRFIDDSIRRVSVVVGHFSISLNRSLLLGTPILMYKAPCESSFIYDSAIWNVEEPERAYRRLHEYFDPLETENSNSLLSDYLLWLGRAQKTIVASNSWAEALNSTPLLSSEYVESRC